MLCVSETEREGGREKEREGERERQGGRERDQKAQGEANTARDLHFGTFTSKKKRVKKKE